MNCELEGYRYTGSSDRIQLNASSVNAVPRTARLCVKYPHRIFYIAARGLLIHPLSRKRAAMHELKSLLHFVMSKQTKEVSPLHQMALSTSNPHPHQLEPWAASAAGPLDP